MIVDLIRESFQQDYEIYNSPFSDEKINQTRKNLHKLCSEINVKDRDSSNKIVCIFNDLVSIIKVSEEQRKV